MRIFVRLTLLLLCLAGDTLTFAQQPLLRHYTVRDGLPSNVVYKIFQDSKGFLWFCTDQGVSQFDGHRFQNYSINEGLPDNEIFNISEDGYGRYWIVCYNHQPCYLLAGKVYTSVNDALCRMIEREGVKYTTQFVSGNGTTYLEGERICAVYKDSVSIAYTDNRGKNSASLYRVIDGYEYFIRGDTINIRHGLKTKIVSLKSSGIYTSEGNANQVCVVRNLNNANTFCRYTLKADTVVQNACIPFPALCYELRFKSDNEVLCLTTDGIYDYNIKTNRLSKWGHFPAAISFNRMLIDSEDNTWLSTLNDGVYMQRGDQTYIINSASGLKEDNVLTLNFQTDGKLISNSSSGGFSVIDGQKITNILLPVSGNQNRIKFTYQLSNHDFLVGSDRGLYTIRSPGFIRHMFLADAQKGCFKKGDLYYVAYSNGALYYNDQTGRTRTFWHDRTTAIAAYDTGNIWLGCLNGLYLYSNGITGKFNKDSVLSNSRITSLAFLDEHRLAITTHKSGLYIWDGKELLHIDKSKGIASNSCSRVSVDTNGQLWLCTDRGLDRISFEQYPSFTIYHYSASDGLPTDKVNDVAVRGEFIYAATSEGIIVLRKKATNKVIAPPGIYILSVITHDSTINYPDKPLQLSFNQNDIQILFTGVSLLNGDEIQYRYVLEGGSSDTIQTRLSALNLSALKPGSYRLVVWAKTAHGNEWSRSPASFSFSINPPFWLTPWFITLAICLISLMIYGIYIRKVRMVERLGMEKAERQQKMAELEMQALRAQINPHFMFNALNSIQHFYSQNNERKANHYMGLFAQLIRKTLNYSKTHWLMLAEELSMLTTYIDLEKMRFKNAFEYDVIVGENIDPQVVRIPAMLIQPYVENAINHGLRHLKLQKGRLLLRFEMEDNLLICSIDDNGIGIDQSLKSKGEGHKSLGMEINRQRIVTMNQIYNTHITVNVIDKNSVDKNEQGTLITIKIPDIQVWIS